MKNILVLLFVLVGFVATAQVNNGYEAFVADTTTNAETEYLVIDTPIALTKDYNVIITIVPVNESGTATVTAMPQGSLDGTKWFDIETSTATVNNAGTVAEKVYTYAESYWRYYRVELVSTGTGVTSFTGVLGTKRK